MTVIDLSMPGWSVLARAVPSRKLTLQIDDATYRSMGDRGRERLNSLLGLRPTTTLRLYSSTGSFGDSDILKSFEKLRYLDVADAHFATEIAVQGVLSCFPRLLGARLGIARRVMGEAVESLRNVRELELHGSGWRVEHLNSPDLRALSLERMSNSAIGRLRGHSRLTHLRFRAVKSLHLEGSWSRFPNIESLMMADLPAPVDDFGWILDLKNLGFLATENVSWRRVPDLSQLAKLDYVYLERSRLLESMNGLRGAAVCKLALIDHSPKLADQIFSVAESLNRLQSLRVGLGDEGLNRSINEKVGVADLGEWKFGKYASPWLGV